jgi:hypothetical protein
MNELNTMHPFIHSSIMEEVSVSEMQNSPVQKLPHKQRPTSGYRRRSSSTSLLLDAIPEENKKKNSANKTNMSAVVVTTVWVV